MIKFLVKIWPSFLPILVYIFWVFVVEGIILERLSRRRKTIEGEKVVGEKTTDEHKKIVRFSLKDPCFVIILYMSLVLAILTLIVSAFSK
jgi:hypothetical protein